MQLGAEDLLQEALGRAAALEQLLGLGLVQLPAVYFEILGLDQYVVDGLIEAVKGGDDFQQLDFVLEEELTKRTEPYLAHFRIGQRQNAPRLFFLQLLRGPLLLALPLAQLVVHELGQQRVVLGDAPVDHRDGLVLVQGLQQHHVGLHGRRLQQGLEVAKGQRAAVMFQRYAGVVAREQNMENMT